MLGEYFFCTFEDAELCSSLFKKVHVLRTEGEVTTYRTTGTLSSLGLNKSWAILEINHDIVVV